MKKNVVMTALLFFIPFFASCAGRRSKIKQQSLYERAHILAQQGAYTQASQLMAKVIARKPVPTYLGFQSALLYQAGNIVESKKILEQLLAMPDLTGSLRADVLNNYAVVLNKNGERKRAELLWEKLTKNSHYHSPEVAWFNLGMLALNDSTLLKQYDQNQSRAAAKAAAQRFKRAHDLEPRYIDALYFRTQAHLQAGNTSAARNSINQLLAACPDHKLAKTLSQQLNKKASLTTAQSSRHRHRYSASPSWA